MRIPQVIGWPSPLNEGADELSEFKLHLKGFSLDERNEIMCALLTLTKHGIRPCDLHNGYAAKPRRAKPASSEIIYSEDEEGKKRVGTDQGRVYGAMAATMVAQIPPSLLSSNVTFRISNAQSHTQL